MRLDTERMVTVSGMLFVAQEDVSGGGVYDRMFQRKSCLVGSIALEESIRTMAAEMNAALPEALEAFGAALEE